MRILNTGTKYSVFDNIITTYDELPVQTYSIGYNQQDGCFLLKHPNLIVNEKTYGLHERKADKVINSFKNFNRSLGVILSGDKGIGKSLFAKLICKKAIALNYPVILVDACVPGIARFIESIDQECVVMFDEFDKTFRNTQDNDDQAGLLSLFDGMAGGKKLYIVTCNELYGLNEYIVNRPGRFHYHFRFEYPSEDDIREYLNDNLDEKYYDQIDKVISFSQKISLNYDCLRAISFELNSGTSFSEAARDLNILNVNCEEYDLTLYFENGESIHCFGFRTNLFDGSQTYTWATMFNHFGNDVATLRYDKNFVIYDERTYSTIIPSEGLYLDFEDYENNRESQKYMKLKPAYLKFKKRAARSLHYIV